MTIPYVCGGAEFWAEVFNLHLWQGLYTFAVNKQEPEPGISLNSWLA